MINIELFYFLPDSNKIIYSPATAFGVAARTQVQGKHIVNASY